MNDSDLIFRQISYDDALGGFQLSSREGWNQTLADWQFILMNLPTSGYVAIIKERVVGTALAINYSDDFSWIAMVLTDIHYRSQGISTRLMTLLLDSLGDKRSIMLDATDTGMHLYRKFGFNSDYQILRMKLDSLPTISTTNFNHISELAEEDIDRLATFDLSIMDFDRKLLITKIIAQKFISISQGKMDGYICMRQGYKYLHIGPLVSTDIIVAKELMNFMFCQNMEFPIILDVPIYQEEFLFWLKSIGFVKQRVFTRMFKNKNFSNTINQNQFITSGPEFG